jgi:PAS domain S-box-containing protein
MATGSILLPRPHVGDGTESNGMGNDGSSDLVRYSVAVGASAVSFVVRDVLAPLLDGIGPSILYLIAVLISAWYGGLRPGLLAMALGVASSIFFYLREETDQLPFSMFASLLVIFTIAGTLISMVCEGLHRARQRIEAHGKELETEVERSHKAEAHARESESRFELLANHAPVSIWVTGMTGCEFVNSELLRYTGRSLPDVIGWGFVRHFHPEDMDRLVTQYRKDFDRRSPFEMQVRVLRADGQYRWTKTVGVPRFTPDGRFVGYVGCSVDIHEMQEYTQQLSMAQDALRAADRQKNDFIAMLSHELRNPLNPIRSAVAILKAKAPPHPELQFARAVIDRQVTQLTRLLDDLLDMSRITQNKLHLRMERVELAPIVELAVEMSNPVIEAQRHRLEVDLPPSHMFVEADSTRLAQVFSNLLINAAKYTPPGGHIRLTATVSGDEVAISVIDTGRGIAPDDLARVFEMFTQVEDEAARPRDGLGIGLALARALVEMHGGSIEVHSEGVGRGSTFMVMLPIAEAMSNGEQAPAAEPGQAQAGRRLILVADDNQDAVDSLEMLLHVHGHEVVKAHDGMEALEAARVCQPHVAILDIGMPKLTGIQVAKRIRAETWGQDMVLIALTGWGKLDDVKRALQAGFDYHLVKPVDLDKLQELLTSEREEREGAESPAE